MKYGIPINSGLKEKTVTCLFYKDKQHGQYSLTDVQYESVEKGVGRGESMLVVSPTSTGKTLIGLIALTRGLQEGHNTVFLVTHRALARQKFEDFKNQLLSEFLDNDSSSLTLATGDIIEDAAGNAVPSPLNSRVMVATYEKYLGLLSASGVPKDMNSTVFICDEIQLIGDENRGQQVEILLTLVKRAGWAQLVGLSAVLEHNDARKLSEWLNINLIYTASREKHLQYECHIYDGDVYNCNTKYPEDIQTIKINGVKKGIAQIVKEYVGRHSSQIPIIVFCMSKKETYDLARQFIKEHQAPLNPQIAIDFDELPETSTNNLLKEFIQYRVACHSADLIDEEREIIEKKILNQEIDVVFATSTLAAGVNFPLGAAFFSSWKRWSSDRRAYVPISSSEFHNMAGRVGRMGSEHQEGKVIFFANDFTDKINALKYLKFNEMPALKSRIEPKHFDQLLLQLVASGLSNNINDIKNIVFNTLSGISEQDNNLNEFNKWGDLIDSSLTILVGNGLLIKARSEELHVTAFGKALSLSGFKPDSGINLLKFFAENSGWFYQAINNINSNDYYKKIVICIFYACFSSPEFIGYQGKKATRFLPYMLKDSVLINPNDFGIPLYEASWQANLSSLNAAKLSSLWIEGEQIRKIEKSFNALTAGMLNDVFRNLVWVLKGISSIILSCSDVRVSAELRPDFLSDEVVSNLRILPRFISKLAFRANTGLTENALWLTALNKIYPERGLKLSRIEMLKIAESDFGKPELLAQGEKEADAFRMDLFRNVKPSPHNKANWLREAAKIWKMNQRNIAAERHINKAKQLSFEGVFKNYYYSRGVEYEKAFEELLNIAQVDFEKLDDGKKAGAPDYLIRLENSPEIIVELKTKQGENLVDLNSATDVLRASELYGYGSSFCVTLCHPGVDPSVLPVIETCMRLSVVEGHDMGEALLRLLSGTLSQEQLWQWLNVPGLALTEDLPMREFVFI
ncbi:DEAD/DEAH box helicase [Yersinia enterocolitica]|nr:DEAD/DEAH box helicase [Yersinia enterocolitica]